jgi:hypothetical protein
MGYVACMGKINTYAMLSEKLKGRERVGNLGIDGWILLKYILITNTVEVL